MKKNLQGLHAIVDNVAIAREVLIGGARIVQFRHKTATAREFLRIARELRKIARESHALFIINDRADIAYIVDADGVHLGQGDLPVGEARKIVGKGRIIGVSTHSMEEALSAVNDGADYIGFGPVFATASKEKALPPRGIDALKNVTSQVSIPVIAIGGIHEDTLQQVLKAGAQGVAMISELASAKDVVQKTRAIQKIFSNFK